MPPEPRYNIRRIVIIGVIVLIIGGLIGFYFINKNRQESPGGTVDTNTFPFPGGQGATSSGSATDGVSIDDTGANPFTVSSGERLRRITDYPVTSFAAFERPKVTFEPKLNEQTGETELVPFSGTETVVRYNIKQNGYLADAKISKDAIVVSQKTATTIPGAEELWFGTNGNPAIFRTWDANARSLRSIAGILPEPQLLDFCEAPLTRDASRGTRGTEVAVLQRYLAKTLGTDMTSDGSFGTKTATALKSSQKALGVPETGMLDTATRSAINADCARRQSEIAASSNEPVTLRATALQDNILRGTVSPDGRRIFFLIINGNGVTGIVADRDGTGQRAIFTSPFTEWMPQWASPDAIAMTTMASDASDGFLYFLNPNNGTFQKVLGPLRGLTTLTSPDNQTVLYSTSTDRGIETRLYHTRTGLSETLDLSTLPAKCGWKDAFLAYCGIPKSIPRAQYPDAWYQGTITFEDDLWSINAATGTTARILPAQLSFDITKIGFSPDKNYIFFVNWIDQTLWSYRLAE